MINETTKPESSTELGGRVEPVVSSELVEAEYAGYRGYHTYACRQDNPYTNEKLRLAWDLGHAKAHKED